jgi:hypothetical protein
MYQNWFCGAPESRSQITDTRACGPGHQVTERLTRAVLRLANTILYCCAEVEGQAAAISRGPI